MGKLQGKVAVVTGASKGIGAEIAKKFGEAGASVVVNYASSREGADRVVAAIEKAGGKAIAVQADVSKAADVKYLFAETKKAFGKVDTVVNNAGVFAFAAIEDFSEVEFHREFGINVLGPLLVTREAVKYFDGQGGSIVNISSVVSTDPAPNSSTYAATKGALDTLSVALSRELGPKNVRVNVIAPGMTMSEGAQALGVLGSDFEKQILARTPLGRIGQPLDIANVAVFLASDESAWVTGARITASGGL